MRSPTLRIVARSALLFSTMAVVIFCAVLLSRSSSANARQGDAYRDKVVPFLKAYCIDCHNAKKKNGDLDLTLFDTPEKIVEDFRQWEHVIGFLQKGEMPPAKAKQPSAELRKDMVATMEKVLHTEARKLAGDPGVVAPRRLTNAEYDYTIADLTGVDIQAAKSFPVDPAAGEGFNNTGEALSLSPSLFKKYYGAAVQVAEHAVLTTQGLRFAPHPTVSFADRQKLTEQAILKFYETHAVDYERYLTSLWQYKHHKGEKPTVDEWAKTALLSPKYARLLWDTLEGKSEDRYLIRWLRSRWQALPASEPQGKIALLSTDIRNLSRELCSQETPAIVPHAGNGPIEHLARRQKTAESRDSFDNSSLISQKVMVNYANVSDGQVKFAIELGDAGDTKADGYVLVKATFTSNTESDNKKKKWSLRELLAEHAPELFAKLKLGTHPDKKGQPVDADSFVMKTPALLEVELPGKAFGLKSKSGVTLTVEYKIDYNLPGLSGVRIGEGKPATTRQPLRPLCSPLHPVAKEYESSGAAFCKLFPNRFFHVDATRGLSAGFHLIEGFFRDDVPLCKSVLSEEENRELDRLWAELYFVTGIWEKMLRGFVFFERSERNFMKHPDFDDFKEEDPLLVKDETLARFQEVYLRRANVKLTGDELAKHPISVFFRDVRQGLKWHAKTLKDNEPIYLKNLLAFAERAYRRPLTEAERAKFEKFYADVCKDKDHGIDAAVRASITRVLVSPHFCMRFAPVPAGYSVAALSDLELASRLSYFLWSGPPDDGLLALAKGGKLRQNRVLREQVRRMVQDAKVTRFAREFFGQWLGYRDFLTQESVNRTTFPTFDDALKLAMFEEPTRLCTHLIQSDKPIVDLLNSDTTFVNKRLADHYGLAFTGSASEWQQVRGLREKGRGGMMGMA